MARQSIVDFYLDAKRGVSQPATVNPDAELAYAELVGPVRDALQGKEKKAAGVLFKEISKATDFSRFRAALDVMEQRGMVRVTHSGDSDPIYSLD